MATDRQILIIDDSPDVQELLAVLFEDEGYKVDVASSGQDALNLLRSTSTLPSLILLDIMMPDMDGLEFRKVQATDSRIAQIPVVIMTADNSIQSLAIECGVEVFLKKPFVDPETVLKVVDKYFTAK